MGHSHWSDDAFQSRQKQRKQTKQTAFTYDAMVRTTGQRTVHPEMNPFGAVRESRDSAAHPHSLSIGIIFDVTGSMLTVPQVLQTKLGALMHMLIQRGYVAHPQILFGAVGDAYCDRVPLQIGQFESGLEMDDDLGKLFLEGGGGGQLHETYELALYFFARHTSIDCFEKRYTKGYLFTIGDEYPYDVVRREHVQRHIGDKLEADVSTAAIIAEVQERYHYFHIIPTNTAHGRNPAIQQRWQELVGERVLLLEDEAAVCETIALAIGLCQGTLDDLYRGMADLTQSGTAPAAADAAAKALLPFATSPSAVVHVKTLGLGDWATGD
jgi:hypothetical protein